MFPDVYSFDYEAFNLFYCAFYFQKESREITLVIIEIQIKIKLHS